MAIPLLANQDLTPFICRICIRDYLYPLASTHVLLFILVYTVAFIYFYLFYLFTRFCVSRGVVAPVE